MWRQAPKQAGNVKKPPSIGRDRQLVNHIRESMHRLGDQGAPSSFFASGKSNILKSFDLNPLADYEYGWNS